MTDVGKELGPNLVVLTGTIPIVQTSPTVEQHTSVASSNRFTTFLPWLLDSQQLSNCWLRCPNVRYALQDGPHRDSPTDMTITGCLRPVHTPVFDMFVDRCGMSLRRRAYSRSN